MYNNSNSLNYNFTGYNDTKIRDDEAIIDQLKKELKRMLYSRRKSAKEFYEKSSNENYYTSAAIDYEED